jgi:hypothetical protein
MVWHPDVGGLWPHDSTVRWGWCGPELPGEQLVIDAQPAVLLLGVGALDCQEAFDEEVLGHRRYRWRARATSRCAPTRGRVPTAHARGVGRVGRVPFQRRRCS